MSCSTRAAAEMSSSYCSMAATADGLPVQHPIAPRLVNWWGVGSHKLLHERSCCCCCCMTAAAEGLAAVSCSRNVRGLHNCGKGPENPGRGCRALGGHRYGPQLTPPSPARACQTVQTLVAPSVSLHWVGITSTSTERP